MTFSRLAYRLMHACRSGFLAVVALAAAAFGNALAQSPTKPQIETNEAYVDAVTRASSLAISDPMAVFALVFDSLPQRVNVYPTENYYYFRFAHDGTRYAGDIRLDATDRDQGKVHFDYYEELQEWTGEDGVDVGLVLDGSRGVTVEKLEPLVYRLSYGEKSVVFVLNDLSQVRLPARALGPDERVIGPIFDESGIRFFLIYNSRLKIFHYILDETIRVADAFRQVGRNDRILIGKRTGFAFYRDQRLDRKILIGAFAANSHVNNYFDGPFDQLPDNFIEGEALREAIVDADPSVKGKINRLGQFVTGEWRYAIHPYMLYRKETALDAVHRCATSKAIPAAAYYACFAFDDENAESANPRPIAMTKRSRPPARGPARKR